MSSDGDDRKRREPLLSDVTTSSFSSSSGERVATNPPASASASDYLPPTSTSISERIAASSSAAGGAPPSLPASMSQDSAAGGARRRARVSLRDYLEKNKPGEYSDDDEEEDPELEEECNNKSKRRGRSRSRSRAKSRRGRSGGRSGGRSVKSRGTRASHSSLRTDATGLISVREVRKAWGAMFFAAVMGSFVGTGGLHRLLNRGLGPAPAPAATTTIHRVPPPPSGGLRGKKGPREPRVFDLDTEGYEDAMEMIAVNNAAESRDRAAARARSQIESKLPPELRMKKVKAIGVDEEAIRDMEILKGAISGAKTKAAKVGADETSEVGDTGRGGDLLRMEEQKLIDGDEKEEDSNVKKKPSAAATSPKFGVGVDDIDDKGLSEDEEDDDADRDKDGDDDDGKDGEGVEGKAGGYAPVSGKRPRRNGDGTVPDAEKP